MEQVDIKIYDKNVRRLLKKFRWNFIPDAILEGSMGQVLVDNPQNPQAVALVIPDFKIHIMGGNPQLAQSRAYFENLPIFSTFFFGAEGWDETAKEAQAGRWVVLSRVAFSSKSLEVSHLKQLRDGLPKGFRLQKIDLPLAQRIKAEKNEMTEDQLFGFESPEDFIERGIGYCVMQGNKMVSIAAAGAVCERGIEVQVNTRRSHEGRGLATAVCAALIIDCLENGIDPNWDAATETSAGLAKKLGYTFKEEYPFYIYLKYRFLVRLRNFLRKIRGKPI